VAQNNQHEFNIHNLRFFTSTIDGKVKSGISRYINFYMLFMLGWISYGILLPVGVKLSALIRKFVDYIGLEIPPIWFGSLFITNYLSFEIIFKLTLANYPALKIGETYEFNAAMILLLIVTFFLRNIKNKYSDPVVNNFRNN